MPRGLHIASLMHWENVRRRDMLLACAGILGHRRSGTLQGYAPSSVLQAALGPTAALGARPQLGNHTHDAWYGVGLYQLVPALGLCMTTCGNGTLVTENP